MENSTNLIKIKFLFIILFFVFQPHFVCAYSQETTHPALTQEIVRWYNEKYTLTAFDDSEGELIIQGSIDEDSDARFMNHFYDPVHNIGLSVRGLETWPTSKEWGINTSIQKGWEQGVVKEYFSGSEDFSWDRAIYEYAWGNKERGLLSLGHVIHLIEDLTVPDHTRDDPHPPYFEFGSPYEGWTKKFNRENIKIEGLEGKSPITLSTIEDYFYSIASYSNNNFLSKDTIKDRWGYKNFNLPIFSDQEYSVEALNDGQFYRINYSQNDSDRYRLVSLGFRTLGSDEFKKTLVVPGDLIMSDYWRLLSRQAVLGGAGVLKLFRDEVAKEMQTHRLKDKNTPKGLFNVWGSGNSVTASLFLATPQDVVEPEVHVATGVVPSAPQPVVPSIAQVAASPVVIPVITPPQVLGAASIPPSNPAPIFIPGFGGGMPAPASGFVVSPSVSSGGSPAVEVLDVTAPEFDFSIQECATSLSTDSCVLATSTVHLSWSSADVDIDAFELSQDGSVATTTKDLGFAITLSSGKTMFSLRARDTAGNFSATKTLEVIIPGRVLVINEVNWAGSHTSGDDQWIELYNPTDSTLNLAGFTLYSVDRSEFSIPLSGAVSSRGFYLIERDEQSVSDITADLLIPGGTRISSAGERLVLAYASTTIDETFSCLNWCDKGRRNAVDVLSMERIDSDLPGADKESWISAVAALANGRDRAGDPIHATPGKRNSVSYLVNNGKDIESDVLLTKAQSPYVLARVQTIAPEATLRIEPGVIIKSNVLGGLSVSGKIMAEGTDTEPIVFTALTDDAYGGDTNNDSSATTPAPGSWKNISFTRGTEGSVIDHAIIRYGGNDTFEKSNLSAASAAFTLSNSISELALERGLYLDSSTSTITDTIFRGMTRPTRGFGATVESGGGSVFRGNTFEGNDRGLYVNGAGGRYEDNIFTNNTSRAFELIAGVNPIISGTSGSGNGLNGILLNSRIAVAQSTTTLNKNNAFPYVVSRETGGATLSSGEAVVLGPGATLKIDAVLGNTGGNFEVRGTVEEPVLFTALADDSDGNDAQNNGTGRVSRIRFSGIRMDSAAQSYIEHARFQFLDVAVQYSASSLAVLKNSSFSVNDYYYPVPLSDGSRLPGDVIENIKFEN